MKKVLLCLGLVVAALFLFGCAQTAEEATEETTESDETPNAVAESDEALAGEAILPAACNNLKNCDFVTKTELYSILGNTWGAVNDNPSLSCANTCRENSPRKTGKCLAGFGFDKADRIMKDTLSCNIKGRDFGISGSDLVCLCFN